MNFWPKKPTMWMEANRLYVSVPFTWNLPELKQFLMQKSIWWQHAFVGGPAIALMPTYLDGIDGVVCSAGSYPYDGVLQRVNPMATKTTTGCIRHCSFCGIGTKRIERGGFKELYNWPDLPIICDNNLLASSVEHFNKVMDRLEKHVSADFNQGLDARLLLPHHAQRFARLINPSIRLACDSPYSIPIWEQAYQTLLDHGCKKSWISTYSLIGFDSNPAECWGRCKYIQERCTCLPMWFHELNALHLNEVTPKQQALGWTDRERIRIMKRFYKAKYGGYVK